MRRHAFSAPACRPAGLRGGRVSQAAPADALARARRLADWFLGAQFDSLLVHAHPDIRDQLTAGVLRQRLAAVEQNAGGEVVEERFVRRNGRTQYWRTAWWSGLPGETITFRLVVVDGMLAGMGINPTSQNPPTNP